MNHLIQTYWSKGLKWALQNRKIKALWTLKALIYPNIHQCLEQLTTTLSLRPLEIGGRWTVASPLKPVLQPVVEVRRVSAPARLQWWHWTVRWWGQGLEDAAASWPAAASWTIMGTCCMINTWNPVSLSQTSGLAGAASEGIISSTPHPSFKPEKRYVWVFVDNSDERFNLGSKIETVLLG